MSQMIYPNEDGTFIAVQNSENMTIRVRGIEPIKITEEDFQKIKQEGPKAFHVKEGELKERKKK